VSLFSYTLAFALQLRKSTENLSQGSPYTLLQILIFIAISLLSDASGLSSLKVLKNLLFTVWDCQLRCPTPTTLEDLELYIGVLFSLCVCRFLGAGISPSPSPVWCIVRYIDQGLQRGRGVEFIGRDDRLQCQMVLPSIYRGCIAALVPMPTFGPHFNIQSVIILPTDCIYSFGVIF
jgi:hypothetical protein